MFGHTNRHSFGENAVVVCQSLRVIRGAQICFSLNAQTRASQCCSTSFLQVERNLLEGLSLLVVFLLGNCDVQCWF